MIEITSARSHWILIVDDDPHVLDAAARMVEQLGHIPVACGSAEEALAKARVGNFDLMLIDYRMPELTGLDLIAILRSEGRLIPALVMTGYPATEERIAPEKLKISGMLRKPIAIDDLERAITDAL